MDNVCVYVVNGTYVNVHSQARGLGPLFTDKRWIVAYTNLQKGVIGNKIFFQVPSQLVNVAALTQRRLNLRPPTAHPAHPLLRNLPSLLLMNQSCPLLTGYPVVSLLSTLDGDGRVPSFGPKVHTHTYTRGDTQR
jgi:hypothetical protein